MRTEGGAKVFTLGLLAGLGLIPTGVVTAAEGWQKHAQVSTDMPLGGPRTPSNLKLLEVTAVIFGGSLAIARITRPSSADGEWSTKSPL